MDFELKNTLVELKIGLKNATEDWLEGLYVVGSLAQDDFRSKVSDIDLIGFMNCSVEPWMHRRIQSCLSAWSREYKGIELSIVRPKEAESPKRLPAYEYRISIGGSWRTEEEGPGKDGELLIHFEIARRSGIDLFVPFESIPDGVFATIPREWIIEELREGITWHLTKLLDAYHDPCGKNSTLNACRALRFAQTAELVSKSGGGEWYLQQFPESKLVEIALDNRQNGGTYNPNTDELRDFIETILSKLN